MTTPAMLALRGLDQPNAAAQRMAPAVTLCRDVAGGTATLRAGQTAYLPKHPGEQQRDYLIRLYRSVAFAAFAQTVEGLVGMVFRQDPQLDDDVPPAVATQTENIDLEGTHLAVFAKELFADCWVAGHGGILVDYPPAPEGLTLATEQALGLRPYWVWYRKENILSWRTVQEGGALVLTQLVLQEQTTEPDGAFGEQPITRYRVLRRVLTPDGPTVTFATYTSRGTMTELVPGPAGVIRNQTAIPFAPVYSARKTGFLESVPPLLDLAYVNLAHYQVQSDHLHSLHKASVPILVRIGATGASDGDEVIVGPNTALDVPTGGDVKYVEHSGAALGQTRQQLQDFKAEMAVLGLRMLMHETRAAETAEAKRIDKAEQDSALSTAARQLQDGLELALQFHATFLGIDDGGSVAVNREFERLQLTGADIDLYAKRVAEGTLSLETLWDIMQRSGHLPEDFDPALERERIAASQLPAPDDEDDEDQGPQDQAEA